MQSSTIFRGHMQPVTHVHVISCTSMPMNALPADNSVCIVPLRGGSSLCRTSDSKCAKKHTRRLQLVPSVQICDSKRNHHHHRTAPQKWHHTRHILHWQRRAATGPVCGTGTGDTSTQRRHARRGSRRRADSSRSVWQSKQHSFQWLDHMYALMVHIVLHCGMGCSDPSHLTKLWACGAAVLELARIASFGFFSCNAGRLVESHSTTVVHVCGSRVPQNSQ